jgi:hypothetical protein
MCNVDSLAAKRLEFLFELLERLAMHAGCRALLRVLSRSKPEMILRIQAKNESVTGWQLDRLTRSQPHKMTAARLDGADTRKGMQLPRG